MLPIRKIAIGDIFQNPLFKDSVLLVVEEIDYDEKLVKIQPHEPIECIPIGMAFWKSNKDRIFSEAWYYYRNS